MELSYVANARVFKAFCDESRLRILELLQNGEKCVCILIEKLPIGQSTISHHLKILVDSGVVEYRKDGKWTYYSLSKQGSELAISLLNQILENKN